MPSEYIFAVTRDSGHDFTWRSDNPEPLSELEALVDGDLYDFPDQPGLWATEDRHTTIERFAWVLVGAVAEDHLDTGVSVAVAR